MKRISFIIILLAVAFTASFAQNVSMEEAATVAQAFFNSQHKNFARCAKIVGGDENRLLYIFNAEDAFVVISGDKNTVPVLAYIDGQQYREEDTIAPFNMWMDNYMLQIDYLKKNSISDADNNAQWERILEHGTMREDAEVEPLVLSHWDQTKFYNYYCPKDPSGVNGRAVTGCVATALGQLIYYFRFPDTGVGEYSYVHEQYGEQYANYGATTYDYDAMCDEPLAINTEISKLIYHCGVGVDMVYGPNSSGMFNHSAAKVLRTYFKYSPETEYLYRDSTNLDWDSVIVSHLERRIPMYYAGWSVPNINGHGFICDGYKMVDSNYYFHFNFGWSGDMDGYFYTNNLFVGGYNFNVAQELIVNCYPDTAQYDYPYPQPLTGSKTLTAMQGTFTDGSLTERPYSNDMDYTWHISPASNNLSSISLKISYNIGANDTLRIFAPGSTSASQIITNANGLQEFEFETDEVTLVFTSDSTSEGTGFRAHYKANEEVFCSGTKMFTAPTGVIDDGSGAAQYNNFSDCKFRLMLTNYSAVIIHFDYLDLEEGHDFLHFYKNTINENNRMLSLTGHIEDTTLILDANRLTIVMETDESGTADGFSLNYEASHVGIKDFDKSAVIHPNPANNFVSVSCDDLMKCVELISTDGRTILSVHPNSEATMIGLEGVPSGVYMLRITTEDRTFMRKLVKGL